MASYKSKFLRGSTIAIFFFGLAGVATYLTKIILARTLEPTLYGLFFAVLAFMMFVDIIKNLGLHESMVKYVPEYLIKKNYGKIKGSFLFILLSQLIMSLVIAAAIFFSADFFAVNIFNDIRAGSVIRILSLFMVVFPLVYLIQTSFKSFHNFGWSTSMEFVKMFLILLLTVLFLKLNFHYLAPAYAYLLAAVILLLVYSLFFIKKYLFMFKAKSVINNRIIKRVLSFGIFTFLTSVGVIILGYIDTITITLLLSLKDVGVYNVAQSTSRIVYLIVCPVVGLLLPITSEMVAKKDIVHLTRWVYLLSKYLFVIMAPILIIILAFPDLILLVLFGGEYVQGYNILRVLTIGIIVVIVTEVSTHVIAGLGKPKINSKNVLIVAFFNIIANITLILLIGLIGAAIATVLSYLLWLWLSSRCVKRKIKAHIPLLDWAKVIIISLICILLINYVKSILTMFWLWEVIICAFIVGIGYIAMLFLFKVVPPEELKMLKNIILLKWD